MTDKKDLIKMVGMLNTPDNYLKRLKNEFNY